MDGTVAESETMEEPARHKPAEQLQHKMSMHQEVLRGFIAQWVQQQEELIASFMLRSGADSGHTLQHHSNGHGHTQQHSQEEGWLTQLEQAAQPAAEHAVENGLTLDRAVTDMLTVDEDNSLTALTRYQRSNSRAKRAFTQVSTFLTMAESMEADKAAQRKQEKEEEVRRTSQHVTEALNSPMAGTCVLRLYGVLRAVECVEQHWIFNTVCALVILANTVVLAVGTEMAMQRARVNDRSPESIVYSQLEIAFTVCYVVELIVKMTSQRARWLHGKDKLWNIFDLLLTASAVQEQLSILIPGDKSSFANMSYLRIVRSGKTLKLLRVIRFMRIFRELRMVLDSVMGSAKAMFWTFILITAILFMFGIAFVQASTEFLTSDACDEAWMGNHHNLCHDVIPDLERFWGSIGVAMLSLFLATTGGEDWGDIAGPLAHAGVHYYFIFLMYIVFFLFVVMNALTSLFVDAAMANSAKDEDLVVAEQLAQKKTYMEEVSVVFKMLSNDNTASSTELTQKQFMAHIDDPALEAFAANLEIDSGDLEQFFTILSLHGTRSVDLETFVVGCIKLRGMAKRMDVMDMMLRLKSHIDESGKFQKGQGEFRKKMQNDVVLLQRSVLKLTRASAAAAESGSNSFFGEATPMSTEF